MDVFLNRMSEFLKRKSCLSESRPNSVNTVKTTKKEQPRSKQWWIFVTLVAGNLMQTWRKRGQSKKIVGKSRDSWHRSEGCGFLVAARVETNLVIRPHFTPLIPDIQFKTDRRKTQTSNGKFTHVSMIYITIYVSFFAVRRIWVCFFSEECTLVWVSQQLEEVVCPFINQLTRDSKRCV